MSESFEDIVYIMLFIALVGIVSMGLNNYLTSVNNYENLVEYNDKTLVNSTLRDTDADVFNKYDYLFMGMSKYYHKPVKYAIAGDNVTLISIYRNNIAPMDSYRLIASLQRFNMPVNEDKGLRVKWDLYVDSVGNKEEVINLR